ncbi:peptidyl-tRNA hydrolase 2, mitochondrial-like [Lingula anatina]|uniref:peptidyl-tRNA hydrolase n=1 Tax=Lingula anatina TaxID=7574 RepID=A0A1S3HHM5_LINAN|nr:peptidyl-tRNA hydrolase 2, mitochondrial-like [Lingula anatina]|eukprot:XP_013384494.1 peptidyl-tRNA hydrolase 2, mitochondrial-like [Lingula anatina]
MLDTGSLTSMAIGAGIGLIIGWITRSRLYRNVGNVSAFRTATGSSDGFFKGPKEEHKLVLVVRNDLKMSKGKIAAQCSHAAVACVAQMQISDPETLKRWLDLGQAKVVVKINDEESMLAVEKKARSLGLNTKIIRDAGRTQVAPSTRTVLGVGPAPVSVLDEVTGHLKLM